METKLNEMTREELVAVFAKIGAIFSHTESTESLRSYLIGEHRDGRLESI